MDGSENKSIHGVLQKKYSTIFESVDDKIGDSVRDEKGELAEGGGNDGPVLPPGSEAALKNATNLIVDWMDVNDDGVVTISELLTFSTIVVEPALMLLGNLDLTEQWATFLTFTERNIASAHPEPSRIARVLARLGIRLELEHGIDKDVLGQELIKFHAKGAEHKRGDDNGMRPKLKGKSDRHSVFDIGGLAKKASLPNILLDKKLSTLIHGHNTAPKDDVNSKMDQMKQTKRKEKKDYGLLKGGSFSERLQSNRQAVTRSLTGLIPTFVNNKMEEMKQTYSRKKAYDKFQENRQAISTFVVHLIATMVIWQHFFFIKFRKQESIPEAANRYWAKRLIPPLEFGAMHAILFQFALLPLTMCHASVTRIFATAGSALREVPIEFKFSFHIYLGYVVTGLIVVASIVFFTFFGLLCRDHLHGREPKDFCEKFTAEIMVTGYVILGSLIVLAATAYFRNRIPYEVFYYIHHLFLLLFAMMIAHTIDDEARGGKERSQTFKWVSGSLAIYLADRLFLAINQMSTVVAEAEALANDSGERGVVRLKLKRPSFFDFRAGEYVQLRCPHISPFYHPFSILNSPENAVATGVLEFSIVVQAKGSWTSDLYDVIKQGKADQLSFTIHGPHGASTDGWRDSTHLVLFGTSTGIVPLLSIASSAWSSMRDFDAIAKAAAADKYVKALSLSSKVYDIPALDSLIDYALELVKVRMNVVTDDGASTSQTSPDTATDRRTKISQSMNQLMARSLSRSYMSTVIVSVLLLNFLLLCLDISFNNQEPGVVTQLMRDMLRYGTYSVDICFALLIFERWITFSFFWRDMGGMFDILFVAASLVLEVSTHDTHDTTSPAWLVGLRCLLRVAQSFSMATRNHDPIVTKHNKKTEGAAFGVQSIRIVWTIRHAYEFDYGRKKLDELLAEAEDKFGVDYGKKVVQVTVNVTQATQNQCDALAAGTRLEGHVFAGRNNLEDTVRQFGRHAAFLPNSRSSVLFCGSSAVGRELKCNVDTLATFFVKLGHDSRSITFRSESYGHVSTGRKKRSTKTQGHTNKASLDAENDKSSIPI